MTRSPIELLWTAKKKYFLNVKRPTAFCIYRLKCSKATSRCDGLDGSGNLYNLYAPLLRAPLLRAQLCDANNLYWLQPFIFVLIALQIIRVSRQKKGVYQHSFWVSWESEGKIQTPILMMGICPWLCLRWVYFLKWSQTLQIMCYKSICHKVMCYQVFVIEYLSSRFSYQSTSLLLLPFVLGAAGSFLLDFIWKNFPINFSQWNILRKSWFPK